jgi:hypothetical protein
MQSKAQDTSFDVSWATGMFFKSVSVGYYFTNYEF